MKRLSNHLIGIDQGNETLFSDFEDGGDMWTGEGDRERRLTVHFSNRFRAKPTVQVALSLYDLDSNHYIRAEIKAENVTETGFDLVFRTWGDSRVARIRASWLAIGEMPHEDDWTVPPE